MVKYIDHMFFLLIYILCFKLSEFFFPTRFSPENTYNAYNTLCSFSVSAK